MAWWAGGIVCIAGAVLALPASRAAAILFAVCGFALAGVYWAREHPGGPRERFDWDDRDGFYERELSDSSVAGDGGGGGDGGG